MKCQTQQHSNIVSDKTCHRFFVKLNVSRPPQRRQLYNGVYQNNKRQTLTVRAQQTATEAPQKKGGLSGIPSGIRLENISKTFKNQTVLEKISWEVKSGEKVGLVGWNGAGKTTTLQIIMGNVFPDGGEVIKAKQNMKVAYLNQEFDITPSNTIKEEFLTVFNKQMELKNSIDKISEELGNVGEDMDKMQILLDQLQNLQGQQVDVDLGVLTGKIEKMMPELGFSAEDNERLVASYSGGWQMRICLGKILLQQPDILLLDEPTNHLDLSATAWLEDYLKQQPIPIVIVSHDREFLDQLCTKIVEVERGRSTNYKGNYSSYVSQKEENLNKQWAAYEKQDKEIKRQEEMYYRLRAGGNAARAQTALKAVERMKLPETFVERPFTFKKKNFRFPQIESMGQSAVQIKNMTYRIGDTLLFDNVSLEIEKGEKVAVIGPNGAGKSTLLKLIMGRIQPQSGTVGIGNYSIFPNYYEQNQSEVLDLGKSVLQTLEESATVDVPHNDIKEFAGRMQLGGAFYDRKVGELSGGEKARLAMAKFMISKGTLLVLDEPTNHLDIPTKEMLEEGVKNFEGTVLAASHDRYFLKMIANRILLVEGGQIKDYRGDYDYFLEQNYNEAQMIEDKDQRKKKFSLSQVQHKVKPGNAGEDKLQSIMKQQSMEQQVENERKVKEQQMQSQDNGTQKKGQNRTGGVRAKIQTQKSSLKIKVKKQ